MREKTILKLREGIVKDAKLRAEILNHELTKYKGQLEKEVQEDFKESVQKELTSSIEAVSLEIQGHVE